MTDRSDDMALLHEGADWVEKMTSGTATDADAMALLRWRSQSPAHARAFRAAVAFRDLSACLDPQDVASYVQNVSPPAGWHSRRMLLGGGLAAAAAGAYVAISPPLNLWPAMGEWTADYHTAKGEQRYLPLSHGLAVEMNTQTSLARSDNAGQHGLKLIDGEIAVTARLDQRKPFHLVASSGKITASLAQFNVRNDGDRVCVTCTAGSLRVETARTMTELTPRHQISYDGDKTYAAILADPAVVTAWRAGQIVLRDVFLADAITEINRYRSGRIIIGNDELRRQRVNTVLRLSEFGHVVALICRATGAHATEVGDFVLLT
jgi:transmembrane sensor